METRGEQKESPRKQPLLGFPGHCKAPDRADLKQRAFRLAAKALDDLRSGATDWEIKESPKQAVQPVIQECEHWEVYKLVLACIIVPGATSEELHYARDDAKEALAEVSIGASQRQLRKLGT